jgi:hypothetical protein
MAVVTPDPKRRWFRFNLRTLFVVVTAMALVTSCLGWSVRNLRRAMQQVDLAQEQAEKARAAAQSTR